MHIKSNMGADKYVMLIKTITIRIKNLCINITLKYSSNIIL